MFIQKNKRGYWEAWERVKGKRRFVKYIGKDPSSFLRDTERGKELLRKLEDYPDLALKGGQPALTEYKRRKMPKVKVPKGQYRTIVIDPPWPMEKIARDVRPNQFEFDYPIMTIDEIKAFSLPVNPEGCHVYLWTTQKFLPVALEVFESWGVKYECLLTWVKNVGFTPFSFMYSTEHCLFGRCGNLPLLQLGRRLDIAAKVREHSRKPEAFYALVREVSPEPRIDIFSRELHEGFKQHGNEKTKF
jgi:N6-adenosine-specific RNA methylase IME4